MNADDLTPAEKDAIQEHWLRRWLAQKQPAGRRIVTRWRPHWPKAQPWTDTCMKPLIARYPDAKV